MSVFSRILKGYRSILEIFLRFVLLLVLCIGTGFVVSYPAWKLAETQPKVFTAVFLLIAGVIAFFFLAKRFMISWNANPRLFILKTTGNVILCAGAVLFIWQVYSRHVALGFGALLLAIIAYGFIKFGFCEAKPRSTAEGRSGKKAP